jgi:hypothetical protein
MKTVWAKGSEPPTVVPASAGAYKVRILTVYVMDDELVQVLEWLGQA